MDIDLIKFNKIADQDGALISLEENKNIPFTIKRVYYIFDTIPGITRGKHSHKDINQLLVCVKGSCTILLDDSVEKSEVNLSTPDVGLMVKKDIWHEMYNFSPDCVLMVLADQYYDEADYIRNYQDFLAYVGNHKK
jgi:dTDP-4-dehydrorhamnose 3,5-epimerase-like enzyme